MPLTDPQERILAYMTMSGWCNGSEVAAWTGLQARVTRHTLMALLRRGLVVHSDHTNDLWLATPRAVRLMGRLDRTA